jgi:hypothetical protein
MKNEQEVKQWLEEQPWYGQFKAHVESREYFILYRNKILNGEFLLDTIMSAFFWEETSEGFDVWNKRNSEFWEWYYSVV